MARGLRASILPVKESGAALIEGPHKAPDLDAYFDAMKPLVTSFVNLDPSVVAALSDQGALEWLTKFRWTLTGGTPTCPRCFGVSLHPLACKSTKGVYRCASCRGDVSIFSNTLLRYPKASPATHLLFLHLICVRPPEMPLLDIANICGMTYKSAWSIARKLAVTDVRSDPFALAYTFGSLLVDERAADDSDDREDDWVGRRVWKILADSGRAGISEADIIVTLKQRNWMIRV